LELLQDLKPTQKATTNSAVSTTLQIPQIGACMFSSEDIGTKHENRILYHKYSEPFAP
jgi:hypothetical protein